MKILLCAIALVLTLARIQATPLNLDGDLTYEITEPRCTFRLNGTLENNTGFGSGTLKLVLWATKTPFPAPGYIVGEYTLGQIPAGSQFSNFKVRTTSKVPLVSGSYHFTLAIAEFNGSIWTNVLAVPTGIRLLSLGDFTDQKTWTPPTTATTAPPKSLPRGEVIRLKLKATGEMNLFPSASQKVTLLTVTSNTRLSAKTPPNTNPAAFTYTVKKNRFNGKKVNSGRLYLDFMKEDDDAESNFTFTLFFQGPTSGTYKSIETNASGSETTWGVFKLP